jgi:hypothetical protein
MKKTKKNIIKKFLIEELEHRLEFRGWISDDAQDQMDKQKGEISDACGCKVS